MDTKPNSPVARPVSAGRFIDKVAWIYIRDRALLVGRKDDSKHFINIGGKRERISDGKTETDLEVLAREVREETGVEIIPDTAMLLHVFKGTTDKGYPLQIRAYTAEHIGLPTPKGELAELQYFTTADKHRATVMGIEILDWLHAQKIID